MLTALSLAAFISTLLAAAAIGTASDNAAEAQLIKRARDKNRRRQNALLLEVWQAAAENHLAQTVAALRIRAAEHSPIGKTRRENEATATRRLRL